MQLVSRHSQKRESHQQQSCYVSSLFWLNPRHLAAFSAPQQEQKKPSAAKLLRGFFAPAFIHPPHPQRNGSWQFRLKKSEQQLPKRK